MEGWRVDGGGVEGWRGGWSGGWRGKGGGVEEGGRGEEWRVDGRRWGGEGGVGVRFIPDRYSQTCTVRYGAVTVQYGTAVKHCWNAHDYTPR